MGKNAKFFLQPDNWDSDSPGVDTPITQSIVAPAVVVPPVIVNNGASGGNAVHRFGKRIIRQRHNTSASTFRSRLLHKHGSYNITGKNIPQRRIRLVSDLWNTLIDLKWRFILILFMLSFVISWALFAVIFYIIAQAHGDLEHDVSDPSWKPCIKNLGSFTAAFLYSVESQHTIGYGFRYTTEECAEAIIFMFKKDLEPNVLVPFCIAPCFSPPAPSSRDRTFLRDFCFLDPISCGNLRPSQTMDSIRESLFWICFETATDLEIVLQAGFKSSSANSAAKCLQAAVGVALQAFMVGVVFAKVQLPKKRAQTLLFSKQAVICSRDGKLCLLFRIGNMRRSLIIQSSVRAQLVHHRKTMEGELLPFHQHEMSIQLDSMSGSAFLAWPVTACHVITPSSPIYDLSKRSLERAKFEMIVILEGVIESTGMVTQARTSYVPEEILWGHRFARLLTYRKESGQYVVDFDRFQLVEPVPDMPECSARQLDIIRHARDPENYSEEAQNDNQRHGSPPSPSLQRAVSHIGMGAVPPGVMDSHSGHSGVHDALSSRRISVQFSSAAPFDYDSHVHKHEF